MSTPLTLIATITATPGHAEALERELRALVARRAPRLVACSTTCTRTATTPTCST